MVSEDLQTRGKIMNAAFALFLKNGYDTTSVQSIIDAVGIAKGTFYHHFKGKEEMLVALVEGMSQRVVTVVQSVVDDPGLDAIGKMLAASRVAIGQKVEDLGPSTIFLVRQMQSVQNRSLADAIERISSQWIRPLYLKIIRQGVSEGVFQVLDAEMAADLFVGLAMAAKNRVIDLFLAAAEGSSDDLDRLMLFYQSLEQGLERLLGAPVGSLPIYSSLDIRGVFARLGEKS